MRLTGALAVIRARHHSKETARAPRRAGRRAPRGGGRSALIGHSQRSARPEFDSTPSATCRPTLRPASRSATVCRRTPRASARYPLIAAVSVLTGEMMRWCVGRPALSAPDARFARRRTSRSRPQPRPFGSMRTHRTVNDRRELCVGVGVGRWRAYLAEGRSERLRATLALGEHRFQPRESCPILRHRARIRLEPCHETEPHVRRLRCTFHSARTRSESTLLLNEGVPARQATELATRTHASRSRLPRESGKGSGYLVRPSP